MSERASSDRSAPRPSGDARAGAGRDDPCGIRPALARTVDAAWVDFFAQWCRAVDLGSDAVARVRAVAATLARPVPPSDGADLDLAGAWAVVRDAMDGSLGPPSLEATA